MPKFVIEREIPNAGRLTAEELRGISKTSCGVLKSMGPELGFKVMSLMIRFIACTSLLMKK